MKEPQTTTDCYVQKKKLKLTIDSVCEIRIALIGYVSVGKTTILNALLQDKYSEVSMKRTTAGVNLFRVGTKEQNSSSNNNTAEWVAVEHSTAQSTLSEITNDNKIHRDANLLHEKTFDVEIEEPLFEMRDDTKLVLVDVPGINEAGASHKYKDYVSENWHTFDCVVIVLDGRQGVNTEEQVELLQIAKKKCQEVKDLSVIILLNKIDDPEKEELQLLVEESRKEVEQLFDTSDQKAFLAEIVSGKVSSPQVKGYSPIVIPLSAMHAYIYQAGSKLSLEQFKLKIDKNLINELGREAYGRRWQKFDDAQKLKKAYEVVSDPEQFQYGIEMSKFDQFLKVLSFCVGGKATQACLLEEQVKMTTSRLDSDLDYVSELKSTYSKSFKIGKPIDFVCVKFKELFEKSVEKAFDKFTGPQEFHHLAKPMNEIFSNFDLLVSMGKVETGALEMVQLARNLVLRQMQVACAIQPWVKETTDVSKWDWVLIYGSMVGVARGFPGFHQYFGLAAIVLEQKAVGAMQRVESESIPATLCPGCEGEISTFNCLPCCSKCMIYYAQGHSLCADTDCDGHNYTHYFNQSTSTCNNCEYKTKDPILVSPLEYVVDPASGKVVPADLELYKKFVNCIVAEAPSDPTHFGHLIWKFQCLLKKVDAWKLEYLTADQQVAMETQVDSGHREAMETKNKKHKITHPACAPPPPLESESQKSSSWKAAKKRGKHNKKRY